MHIGSDTSWICLRWVLIYLMFVRSSVQLYTSSLVFQSQKKHILNKKLNLNKLNPFKNILVGISMRWTLFYCTSSAFAVVFFCSSF